MALFDILQSDISKVKTWFLTKEPALITAIQDGLKFATAALAWRASSNGVGVVAFVESEIPKTAPYFDDGVKIATAMLTDLTACQSPSSWKGIALRLGAEIALLVHGGKLPSGIDGYIAEMQNIFVG